MHQCMYDLPIEHSDLATSYCYKYMYKQPTSNKMICDGCKKVFKQKHIYQKGQRILKSFNNKHL